MDFQASSALQLPDLVSGCDPREVDDDDRDDDGSGCECGGSWLGRPDVVSAQARCGATPAA